MWDIALLVVKHCYTTGQFNRIRLIKMPKFKCDILSDFHTMWHSGLSGGISPKNLWKKPVADVLDFCLVRSKANEDVEKCFVTTC